MNVLVTGASGFLGSRLVRQLLDEGMVVRCLIRDARSAEQLRQSLATHHANRLEIVLGLLDNTKACAQACAGCQTVFHVAAAMRGSPASLFLNNVIGTQELISTAGSAGVKRFVLVSSLGVYGTGMLPAEHVLDETCPIDPQPHLRDAYSFSKIAQEEVVWKAHQEGDIAVVVVRPGVIYGPGRECLSNRVGLRVGNWVVKMGGRQILPYTFVDNCANAIRLAGTSAGIEGQAFNIVDDDPPSASKLVKLYRAHVHSFPVFPVPRWLILPLSRACECYHRWSKGQLPAVLTPYKSSAQWKSLQYANTKAKKLLGWVPRVDFENGLQQTFEWLCKTNTLSKVGSN